jgi:biotin-(acetyl-CoA carboxylase) ligase
MEKPPPLQLLRSPQFDSPNFTHIPQTPAARKHWSDQKLYTPQKKLENAMQQLVKSLEQGDPQVITTAGALIRSAWEDLHQARRENLAGRQRAKLDKRADDIKPRLLTAEEETKINQSYQSKGKGKGKGKSWYSKTENTGRGKGKGKGKGKWGKKTPNPSV